MPELRSRVRRVRAQATPAVQAERPNKRRRRAARNQQPVDENPPVARSAELQEEIRLAEGGGEVGGVVGEVNLEGVGERRMDECDSGARSAEKLLPRGEDEGSAAPLPVQVRAFYAFCIFYSCLLILLGKRVWPFPSVRIVLLHHLSLSNSIDFLRRMQFIWVLCVGTLYFFS